MKSRLLKWFALLGLLLFFGVAVIPSVNAEVVSQAIDRDFMDVFVKIVKTILSIIGVIMFFSVGFSTYIIDYIIDGFTAILEKINLFPNIQNLCIQLSDKLEVLLLVSLVLFTAFAGYLSGLFDHSCGQGLLIEPFRIQSILRLFDE